MKKTHIILITLMLLLLFSCDKDDEEEKKEEGNNNPVLTVNEELFALVEAFSKKENFKGETTGTVKTEILFINYTQSINSQRIKTKEGVFSETITHSSFVKNAYQYFFVNDNVFYKEGENISEGKCDWNEEINRESKNEYLDKHGSLPSMLTHFILNNDTIIGSMVEEENNNFIYTFNLDQKTAPLPEIVDIKYNLGENADPEFISITLVLVVNREKEIKEMTMLETYYAKVPILGKVLCKANIKEKFTYETTENIGYEIFQSVIN